MEPGETLTAAALREVAEETGFTDLRLGPVVWTRSAVVPHLETGESLLFEERYLVAHCAAAEPNRGSWTDVERRLIDDIRWWSLEELRASREIIFPEGRAELLPEILGGVYPDPPAEISVFVTLDNQPADQL